MSWDESEHPRDEIGRFTFKNGGEEEDEKNEKEKKGGNEQQKERKNNQNDFSNMKPFKLGAEYNDIRTETPTEVLYGKNSKTTKDKAIQKERNSLIEKLGNVLSPKQVLYSSLDELKQIARETKNNSFENAQEATDNDFKFNFKKHDELKNILLNRHSKNKQSQLPKGYELKEKYHSNKTGLDVEIYEHENEIILSFPGSEQVADYKTDIWDIKFKNKNPQLDEAQKILNDIKSNPQYKNRKIIVTGYSLGGNIAAGLSAINNLEGVTFNSYGDLNKIIQQKANETGMQIEVKPENLINYRHEKDGISNYKHLGVNYKLPTSLTKLKSNVNSNHDIKNISKTIQRYPQEATNQDKNTYYPKLK